ncbi:MAG TPA: Nif3-like dinuclear metal center hexameric protein [Acidobacteriota bacterium]|nr:Nif3-like dinuclear metal center hexameric protein [Acidobacteriota bacterium]
MRRREFIGLAGAASAGAVLGPAAFAPGREGQAFANAGPLRPSAGPAAPSAAAPLLVRDVAARLRAITAVAEPSVDRLVIGDPAAEVAAIGTCWLPYWDTCRQAVGEGINLLVVHEPAFYTHWDLDEKSPDLFGASAAGREAYLETVGKKKAWVLEHRLAIIRCHDALDKIGGWGVPFAFGEALGFRAGDIVRSRPYYNVYRVEPRPAAEVAGAIARRLAPFGQPGVAFYGDRDRVVGTVGVGTGCYCDPIEFMDLRPDLFIALDDVVRTWTQTVYARDTGHPLVVINHGTSEEAGMRALSEFLKKTYPGRRVVHYPQGCGYEWVAAAPPGSL